MGHHHRKLVGSTLSLSIDSLQGTYLCRFYCNLRVGLMRVADAQNATIFRMHRRLHRADPSESPGHVPAKITTECVEVDHTKLGKAADPRNQCPSPSPILWGFAFIRRLIAREDHEKSSPLQSWKRPEGQQRSITRPSRANASGFTAAQQYWRVSMP